MQGGAAAFQGSVGLRFNSTATHTALLSRILPWDPSETAGSSFQKPPGTATQSKEVFLPSSSSSQPELSQRASPGTGAQVQADFAGIPAGMVGIQVPLKGEAQSRSLQQEWPFGI